MQLDGRRLSKVVVCIAIQLCTVSLWAAEVKAPKDMDEAHKWFQKEWEAVGYRDVKYAKDETGVSTVTYKSKDGHPRVLELAYIDEIHYNFDEQAKVWKVHYVLEVSDQPAEFDWWVGNASKERAEQFFQGLWFMVRAAQDEWEAMVADKLAQFKDKAAIWRAMAEKPKMPEDAYAHKVLAEDAYKEKNLSKAMNEYVLAFKTYPMWPEGQFNAALIAEALHMYRVAYFDMQRYLLLAPDAPDAQSAKDKIILWKDKAKHL